MHISYKIAGVIGTLALLGTGGVVASTAAGATVTAATTSAPLSIKAVTAVSNHPDTTSGGTGTACTSSTNGPVWANDSYTSKLAAVNVGPDTWRVTLHDNGSFVGFADPNTCNAKTSKGGLIGLYTVTVTSANTPSQATLHPSYTGAVSTTQMVQDFFNDPTATVVGGDYFFVYQGGNYVQTTSSIYGDV